ncbi:MAG: Octanoyltransferase [Legionellaceae bacterium]
MITSPSPDIIIKYLPDSDYLTIWQAMKAFTQNRTAEALDEIWFVEHSPVFTLGQNAKPEHLLNIQDIPIIHSDRGGQVTYHGPGQVIVYILIDIKRKKFSVRDLINRLENTLIALLAEYEIKAYAKPDAPGVYVNEAKIGSIGLRIRKNCSYHGISFNFSMDLSPFKQINPCGYKNLAMTQLSELINDKELNKAIVVRQLTEYLLHYLQYQQPLLNI